VTTYRALLKIIDVEKELAGASAREWVSNLRESAAMPAFVAEGTTKIIADVRARGDVAVRELTLKFDGPDLASPFLPEAEWDRLAALCPAPVRASLELAAERVRAFHRPQIPQSYEQRLPGGGRLRNLTIPLERAACYVPGGRAAYPSTVIMTAAVARLCGVPDVIVATPPRRDGSILPEVAAAARIAGATRILRAGGAQAVAALAIGTAAVPRVDCIVGPGNAWVTEAKKQLSGEVRIDSLAGPTEVVIVADSSANPAFLAADLIAQAEHDPLALAVLVTNDRALAEATAAEVERQLAANPLPVASEALLARGCALVTSTLERALALADEVAPEHLELVVRDTEAALRQVPRAAAVFVGPYAPVPVGDYLAGPNHTLPTSGTARFANPLSCESFLRRQNVIEYGEAQLAHDAPYIADLANAEGLPGHGRAVLIRKAASVLPPQLPPEAAIRHSVRPLEAYGPPRAPAAVPLHLNESPSDLPAELKAALAAELVASDWSKYPITDGAKLAALLAKAAGVDPAGVLVGNGSNELLQLLLFASVEPGDAVVVATPSFSLYALQAEALGARVIEVPLRSGADQPPEAARRGAAPQAGWGPDGSAGGEGRGPVVDRPFDFPVEQLAKAARDSSAKLILLGSPNNPTGTLLSTEGVKALLAATPGLVCIDEAYRDFCSQDLAPLLAQNPRLVLFRTFSKALAAASLRCGSLFGAPALVHELRKVQLPYNLSAFTCRVAAALLERPQLVRERAALVVAERERVAAAVRAQGCTVHASGANFLLFEQGRRAPTELHAALFKRGVLIRNISSHPLLPRALRVSIGSPANNDAFLVALRAELP
jgi:histidinol dehydrogenase